MTAPKIIPATFDLSTVPVGPQVTLTSFAEPGCVRAIGNAAGVVLVDDGRSAGPFPWRFMTAPGMAAARLGGLESSGRRFFQVMPRAQGFVLPGLQATLTLVPKPAQRSWELHVDGGNVLAAGLRPLERDLDGILSSAEFYLLDPQELSQMVLEGNIEAIIALHQIGLVSDKNYLERAFVGKRNAKDLFDRVLNKLDEVLAYNNRAALAWAALADVEFFREKCFSLPMSARHLRLAARYYDSALLRLGQLAYDIHDDGEAKGEFVTMMEQAKLNWSSLKQRAFDGSAEAVIMLCWLCERGHQSTQTTQKIIAFLMTVDIKNLHSAHADRIALARSYLAKAGNFYASREF